MSVLNRPLRFNRTDRDKDALILDWSKDPQPLLHEILWGIVKGEVQYKKKLLDYLNCFIKFCNKFKNDTKELNFSSEEIFKCLRTSLLHDSAEIRAAGIRSIRHFIKNEEHVNCIYKFKIDFLIARSIDICLDNKTERIQALRLIRKLLSIDYQNFSISLARCLIAISRDSNDKNNKDLVLRTCLAILSELIILNPELSYKCDLFNSLMDSLCKTINPYNILESVLGSYLYLINNPELRVYTDDGSDLQKFIGIFSDLPYVSWLPPNENKVSNNQIGAIDNEEIETRFNFIKNILVSVYRSWPGLIFMCQTSKNDNLMKRNPANLDLHGIEERFHNFQIKNVQNLNGIQTLIEMMYLPFEDTRKYLMEIIFELFYLPIPEWIDDFDIALFSTNLSIMQESWQLYNGFVAAEAKFILPHISKNRVNFVNNYISLLLYSFISNGLLESLISIIISPGNLHNSVRATILIGELLHLTNQYLPPEMSQVCHSLPQLMKACISDDLTINQKTTANAAISCLNKMHSIKKKQFSPCSLFLDLILQFSNPSYKSSIYDFNFNKWKIKDFIRQNEESSIINAIRTSQVLLKDYIYWDWFIIGHLLKLPSDFMKKVEENSIKTFIRKIIFFFKPTSKQFSSIDHNDINANEISSIGLSLIDFLLECEESKSSEYIDEFITDLNLCLSQITIDNGPSANCIFGPGKMLTTLSSSYFLFIGKMSNSIKGRKILEKSGIYDYLVEIISSSTNDVYVKLILSSLDYNQANFSRKLLNEALVCELDSARLYATNFLRVLLRVEVKDFHNWVIELLIQQLNDKNMTVSSCAVDILDEACDKIENLTELVFLHPSLLHLKDKGVLLFCRYASCKEGFKYLKDTNLLNFELERWKDKFYLKYVNLIEEILNETFTYHQKGEDDSYGRRVDKKCFLVKKNAYILPHFYGQLALCKEGCELLLNEKIIPDLISQIKKILCFDEKNKKKLNCAELIDYNELTILKIKGSMWALSHIASTELGLELIKDTDLIQILVELAKSCQLLSIRATSFYCLGLISTTEFGSILLNEFDWTSLRHSKSEKWPIFKEMIEKNKVFSFPFKKIVNKNLNSSITSVDTKTEDGIYLELNDKNFNSDFKNENDLTIYSKEERVLSKSLSHIDYEKIKILNEKSTNSVLNKTNTHLQYFDQVRPRSSSDCQQRVSFNLKDKKTRLNSENLDNNQYNLNEINEVNKDFLEENETSSSDQLTSPYSLSEIEGFNTKIKFNESQNMYHSSNIIEENSAFDINNSLNSCSNSKNQVVSNNRKNNRKNNIVNSIHFAPKRKTSEPIGSIDFKTFHMRMIKHNSVTNIYHSQLKNQKNFETILNSNSIDEEMIHQTFSTSFPESFSPANSDLQPISEFQNKDVFRKISQISYPNSLEKNYSLFINPQVSANDSLDLNDCDYVLGLQDKTYKTAMPSTVDTIGYAALKTLQHKKKKSGQILMFNDQFSNLKDCFLQNNDIKDNDIFDMSDHELLKDVTMGFKLASMIDETKELRLKSDYYVGICLPNNLSLIFDLEQNKNSIQNQHRVNALYRKVIDDKNQLTSEIAKNQNGFKLHSVKTCLLIDDHHLANNIVVNKINLNSEKIKEKNKRNNSITEFNLDEEDHVEIRKEIIKLVCRLSSCIYAAKTEVNLLSLKQKFPIVFQDVCLYSEICLHISNYSFSLHSRRFLQELFLDVDFKSLFIVAKNVLHNKSPLK